MPQLLSHLKLGSNPCLLCALKLTESVGYQLEPSIGNNGTFYYPKLDLVATTMILKDLDTLTRASEENRHAIMELRNNLTCIRVEELRKKQIEIHYDICIPNMDKWNLEEVVRNMRRIELDKSQDYSRPDLF